MVFEAGGRRLGLQYQLCIDTNNDSPVCCWSLLYGDDEGKIMSSKVLFLEDNGK